jgi:hypothetical protein
MAVEVGSIPCDRAVEILVHKRSDYWDQGILPAAHYRERGEGHCNPLGNQDHGEDRHVFDVVTTFGYVVG